MDHFYCTQATSGQADFYNGLVGMVKETCPLERWDMCVVACATRGEVYSGVVTG